MKVQLSIVPPDAGTGNDPSPGNVPTKEGSIVSVAGVQSDDGVQNTSVQNVQNDGMQNENVQNDVGMQNKNVQNDVSMQNGNVQNVEGMQNENVQIDEGMPNEGVQNDVDGTQNDVHCDKALQYAECVQNDFQSGTQSELTCHSVAGGNASACDQEHDFNSDLGDEEDMDDLDGEGSVDADETPCPGASESQIESGADPVEKESEVSTKHGCSNTVSTDSSSYASVIQGHSVSLVDTPRTSSSEDSIMEFSENSASQSVLGPKVPPVTYGSHNLQWKVKNSVISKLLPRKQQVARSGHHALPAVASSRPSLGAKPKKH